MIINSSGRVPADFTGSAARVCVVICTRNRPQLLRSTLEALADQSDQDFELIVVDQSDEDTADARASWTGDRSIRILTDSGRGLSRARNLAWRQTQAQWLVFVDDDCLLESDWIATLKRIIAERSECSLIVGRVNPLNTPAGPYLPTGVLRVPRERLTRGRWRPPLSIGFGVCMAVRRETVAALGGWDERLGTGSRCFPGAEDEDFNYRLLRQGGTAYATPDLVAWHDQWRTQGQLISLFRDYMIGRGGLAAKHVRTGDVSGGAWLLALAMVDCLTLLASGVLLTSGFRLGVGRSSLLGFLTGLARGLRCEW